ncbi:MAG: hypothetical protein IKE94_16010, partial [Aeriscardovia sp.]|nr:hypothetical protein [Aeriscardovia sp.]
VSDVVPSRLLQRQSIEYTPDVICIGVPFGIRRMFLWLVPHRYDLAGTVGVFVLDVVLGGIIGGFALIFQILGGVIETVKG